MPNERKTVGVFFGGDSNEHEISVITGLFAANLLRGAGYRVVAVYLPRAGGMTATDGRLSVEEFRRAPNFPAVELRGRALFRAGKKKRLFCLDVALNCCHGGAGEDGTLSALLAWNGLPCASPPTAVSALFMNKHYGKIAAMGLKIPVARAVLMREGEACAPLPFGFPVIVKPARLGSSIGIEVARDEKELAAALGRAYRLDDSALVEEYFRDKRDLNCAAYRKDGAVVLSPVEEVFSGSDVLTFSEKYERAERRSAIPADIPEAAAEKVRAYTKAIYENFDVRGVVRADFLLAGGEVYFNELNTVPGSLAFYLFGERLTDARAFLSSLVEEALANPPRKKETLPTGLLEGKVFAGGKGCKRRRNLV